MTGPVEADQDRRAGWGPALTLLVLASYEALRTFVLPGPAHLIANLIVAGILVWIAFRAGLSSEELGLSRDRIRAGLRWGLPVVAAVALVMGLGAAIPSTRELLETARPPSTLSAMLFEVLVEIPLGTVVLEELAFRGSLLAFFERRTVRRSAVIWSSALFALWHLLPSIWDAPAGGAVEVVSTRGAGDFATVAGVLAATFVAGLVFCWLRIRSDSLVAPALAHAATNSLAVVAVWLVAR